jgi:hypothetical protein
MNMIVRFLFVISLNVIHEMLEMVENAMMFRVSLVFIIDNVPTSEHRIAVEMMWILLVNMRIISGMIFCHVIRIPLFVHFNCLFTSRNHECKGGAPIFITPTHRSVSFIRVRFIAVLAIRTAEQIDWIRKYFMDESFSFWLDFFSISMQKAMVFISIISQRVSHEDEDIAKVVDRMVIDRIEINILVRWNGFELDPSG